MKMKYTLILLVAFLSLLPASGQQKTAAVSTISGEELLAAPVRNLEEALIGRLPGLIAMQTATGVNFSIRGQQTLSDNGIIVLVDGFERPINSLRPEEVESVSLYKDAAATALYGYRGVNGVISIKTRRGGSKSLEVNAGYEHIFNSCYRMPEMVSSYDYAQALNTARSNDGLSPYYNSFESDAFKTGSMPELYPDVSWRNEVLRRFGHNNIFHVDFNGGSSKVKYYVFLNLQYENGFLKNFKDVKFPVQFRDNRAEIRTNIDAQLTKTTTMTVNLAGHLGADNAPHGTTFPDLMHTFHRLPSAAFPISLEDNIWGGDAFWGNVNPVARVKATGYDQRTCRMLLADITLHQDFSPWIKGLAADLKVSFDSYADFKETHMTDFQYNRLYPVYAPDGTVTGTFRPDNLGNKVGDLSFNRYLNWQWRRTNVNAGLTYNGKSGDHGYLAKLLYSFQNFGQSGANNTFYRQNLTAFLEYAYRNAFVVDFSLTGSGSNRNHAVSRYALSPVLSFAWLISQTGALKNVETVDELKLRASAGLLHNDYLPQVDIVHQNFCSAAGSFIYGTGNTQVWGCKEGFLPTSDPKLERAFKYDLGLDGSFFKSLRFTFDVYFQNRDRIFVSSEPSVSNVLGVQAPYLNAGKVYSYGTEFGIGYTKKIGSVSLDLGADISFNRNILMETIERPDLKAGARRTGHAADQYFGLESLGFFEDQEEIDSSPIQTFGPVKPGDVKYKDQNGDGLIDENDEVAIGSGRTPELYFSFRLGFFCKGIGLDALFQGVGNRSVYLSEPGVFRPMVNQVNISEHYLQNCWMPEGNHSSAVYPRLSSLGSKNNDRPNDIWIVDGSFLKLRNLDLYYSFPAELLKKIHIDGMKIFLRGMNLFSADAIKVMDPETVTEGLPSQRTFSVGLSVKF